MFDHYTFGMQAQPLRRRSRELSPGEVAAASGHMEPRQCPSPPLSTTTMPTVRIRHDSRSAPDSIDRLAQELSKQNLQLDRANLEQLQLQLSSPTLSPQTPSLSLGSPCPDLEVDNPRQISPDSPRGEPYPPALAPPSPVEPDQRFGAPDARRLMRQRSSQFNNNPSNTRTIQDLVRGMVESGSQCNIHVAPSPRLPHSQTTATRLGPTPEPEDDPMLDLGNILQVDEAYINGPTSDTEREEKLLIETMMSFRRAGAPAGVRKTGALAYRASAEAALNCANLVRSRPRMRKRGKMHLRSSKASSTVSLAFSSPVVPPSLPKDAHHVPFTTGLILE